MLWVLSDALYTLSNFRFSLAGCLRQTNHFAATNFWWNLFLYFKLTNKIHSLWLQIFLLEWLTPQLLQTSYTPTVCDKESDKNRTTIPLNIIVWVFWESVYIWVCLETQFWRREVETDRNKFLVHTYTGIYDLCQCFHQNHWTADRHCTALKIMLVMENN